MAKFEAAEKQCSKDKKKDEPVNAMKAAVDSTEAIRQWEDHMWPFDKLE
jgi:hypothetical protein